MKSEVSSAKSFTLQLRFSVKSFMHIKKKRGPKILWNLLDGQPEIKRKFAKAFRCSKIVFYRSFLVFWLSESLVSYKQL